MKQLNELDYFEDELYIFNQQYINVEQLINLINFYR